MRVLFLIMLVNTAIFAGTFADKIGQWKDSISVGAIGAGLIIFLIMNVRRLIEEIKDVLEQVKIVAEKFKTDPDVKKLLIETDEALEVMASIAARVGAGKLAKKLRDLIK